MMMKRFGRPYRTRLRTLLDGESGTLTRRRHAMKRRTAWLLLLGSLLVTSSVAWARVWKTVSGTYSIEAEFAGVEDGKALLKKTDGKVVAVPLEKLSDADRAHIASLQKPVETPEPAVPAPATGAAG
ncbi:MAG: SHD1 domain-containing protein, partial [Planctomycetia bacterium]|nr:SHD1 domain-containing protein [Planctomycetia bacterium]